MFMKKFVLIILYILSFKAYTQNINGTFIAEKDITLEKFYENNDENAYSKNFGFEAQLTLEKELISDVTTIGSIYLNFKNEYSYEPGSFNEIQIISMDNVGNELKNIKETLSYILTIFDNIKINTDVIFFTPSNEINKPFNYINIYPNLKAIEFKFDIHYVYTITSTVHSEFLTKTNIIKLIEFITYIEEEVSKAQF